MDEFSSHNKLSIIGESMQTVNILMNKKQSVFKQLGWKVSVPQVHPLLLKSLVLKWSVCDVVFILLDYISRMRCVMSLPR